VILWVLHVNILHFLMSGEAFTWLDLDVRLPNDGANRLSTRAVFSALIPQQQGDKNNIGCCYASS
jgi:hypothetical protein